MSTRHLILCAFALASCSHSVRSHTTTVTSANAEEQAAVAKRLDRATKLVTELAGVIPEKIETNTRCAIVVPALARGGMFIGAERGKGFASCRSGGVWSAPEPVTITGGSIGAQFGLETLDIVMLTLTDGSMRKLLRSGFEVGPSVSVAAGPVGKGRESATDATF